LGLNSNANDEDIKIAYKKLAQKFHPDRNLDNIEFSTKKFQEINNAYQILSKKL
jgi:DnaJ-class molecular chaperone